MPPASDLNHLNDRYCDFIVTKVTVLQELNAVLRELVHEPTGASVLHIENDDPENLFCLSFKTFPSNNNGVAHILEHTVLCGSRKYPIKDPFFSMSRRSLNTFMNAMTGADFTCYPAASQVKQDYYNILEVYLDAVFHPQLKEMSFLQEGHRLEFKEPTNPNSSLEFKGIVYNEMKGSLSSRDARLIQKMMQAIFPDLPYAYNSGGDPKEIPQLSYAELISFHETYYHPSRCLFYFYGNLPIKEQLDFISEKALKNTPKETHLPPIKKQTPFLEPLYLEDKFPIEASEIAKEKSIIAFGWLTLPLKDQETLLALSLLDSIIMDTDASLLKLPLLKSKLCIQVGAFMDTEMSEVPYLIICKGCDPDQADLLQKTLFLTLEEIALNGIPHYLIEAAIHQLEFSRTEIAGNHAPFGLTLFLRSGLAKQHQCPPENALLIHSLFTDLLIQVKDPEYLPSLIRKYFLNNPHFVRLVMKPDTELASQEAEQEKKVLEEIKKSLSEEKKEEIILQTAKLEKYQKEIETQSLNCLPKISRDDIPKIARDFSLYHEQTKNIELFHHDCFTNHIVYADLIFDLPPITEEELPYLQLLISLLTEVGVGDRDYAANLEYIHAHTGGVSASTALYVQTENPHLMKPCITLRGKSLMRKADKLFSLLKEIPSSLRLDEKKRIEELLLQLNNAMQNRLNRNALRYAIQLSLSGFSTASYISEAWSGLKYYQTIQQLVAQLPSHLDALIERLFSLKERLFNAATPHLVLSCDQSNFQDLYKKEFYGITELPKGKQSLWKPDFPTTPISSQARLLSSPVAFTCEAFKTVTYLHPDAPALSIATLIMDNKILHARVREQGGAYGVGAHYAPMLGQFYFHAYRDPHIQRTLNAFHESIDYLATVNIQQNDLEEAVIGMIQQLDAPISPGSRGIAAYSWWREGKTKEMRQNYRHRILSLHSKEIQHAVEQTLFSQKEKGIVVALADQALLEKENKLLATENRALPIFPI